jgi:hypothetical protein
MEIQIQIRQYYHLWYVSARINLRIGIGLEGGIQTYRSAAGQLVQWICLIFPETTVRISSEIY